MTFGPVIGVFLTGLLAERFVLPKLLRNDKVQKLLVAVETIADHAEKFDKLLLYAEKIAENQEGKKR